MQNFKLIEHMADVGVEAWGGTLDEAFAGAACGLFSLMADLSTVRGMIMRSVEVEGLDEEMLLFNWINELIYIFEVDHMLCSVFNIEKLTNHSLSAVCSGEKYDPAVHRVKMGVKSATLHNITVDRAASRVRVILDV